MIETAHSDGRAGTHPLPQTQELLPLWRSILDAIGPCAKRDHLALWIRLPEGALHFPMTSAVPSRKWSNAEFRFLTSSGTVRVEIELVETTDLTEVHVALEHFSPEDATSTTVVTGCRLTLQSLRQAMVHVFSWFSPFSVSVTASD